jgi:hypothetical protein
MDMSSFLNLLLATDNPLLPHLTLMQWALRGGWMLVLGSGVLLLARQLAAPYRVGLIGLVMVWTALPGAASPVHWLGLAFQAPSLMSMVICLAWLLSPARWSPVAARAPVASLVQPRLAILKIMSGLGVILGWVLLLDTLAWLPVSVYAWGFSSAAVAALAVCAALLWLRCGSVGLALPLLVLTLFVLTRLPTGNVWDALLDPWLWVALQLWCLGRGLRWLKLKLRLSPATRA